MERVLSPDEKLKRAEEIYYKRRGMEVKENRKTVSVPISNNKYLVKKMVLQIIVCLLIYCTYFAIKNHNFLFSEQMLNKTKQMLSYDINIQGIYCKVVNYINNYDFFNKNKEEKKTNEEENQKEELINEESSGSTSKVEEILMNIEESNNEEIPLTQMEIDANDINQKYEFSNPLQGQITSRFGPREVTSPQISPYHVGLDIAANTGTVFLASIGGTVKYSGELDGYGKCLQIQTDDILVIYGHCSKLYVNIGDIVTKGQELGEVGETGNATGPHLHFEIRKSERYVDPELIFQRDVNYENKS